MPLVSTWAVFVLLCVHQLGPCHGQQGDAQNSTTSMLMRLFQDIARIMEDVKVTSILTDNWQLRGNVIVSETSVST